MTRSWVDVDAVAVLLAMLCAQGFFTERTLRLVRVSILQHLLPAGKGSSHYLEQPFSACLVMVSRSCRERERERERESFTRNNSP
jgi:hypothetical protein